MQVYRINQVEMGGTLYLDSLTELEGIIGEVEDQALNTKFEIEVIEMDKTVFQNLPEFECFE